jgi:hypothetical protein
LDRRYELQTCRRWNPRILWFVRPIQLASFLDDVSTLERLVDFEAEKVRGYYHIDILHRTAALIQSNVIEGNQECESFQKTIFHRFHGKTSTADSSILISLDILVQPGGTIPKIPNPKFLVVLEPFLPNHCPNKESICSEPQHQV